MTIRKMQERRGWAFVVAVSLVKPTMLTVSRREWTDGDKIPTRGGCVIVCNHITQLDPFLIAHFLYDHGRLPRYLAKSGLFRNKYLARYLRAAGQIPVERLTSTAADAFGAAVEAVEEGKCVVVYPEGTVTRDPDLWPMVGKSGAARIALATGCPVIPVAQWGGHEVLAPYTKRLHVLPRRTVHLKAGDPVPLEDLRAKERTPEVVRQATDRIMESLTDLLATMRPGETPPAERYDPRRHGVREIGNPNEGTK